MTTHPGTRRDVAAAIANSKFSILNFKFGAYKVVDPPSNAIAHYQTL